MGRWSWAEQESEDVPAVSDHFSLIMGDIWGGQKEGPPEHASPDVNIVYFPWSILLNTPMTSAEFAACDDSTARQKFSLVRGTSLAGLFHCGGGLPSLSPLTVVTAETASKQLRAVKSHWNVRQPGRAPPPAFFLCQISEDPKLQNVDVSQPLPHTQYWIVLKL